MDKIMELMMYIMFVIEGSLCVLLITWVIKEIKILCKEWNK